MRKGLPFDVLIDCGHRRKVEFTVVAGSLSEVQSLLTFQKKEHIEAMATEKGGKTVERHRTNNGIGTVTTV